MSSERRQGDGETKSASIMKTKSASIMSADRRHREGTDMGDAWFVYVLECADGTLYTGVTKDIVRRLREHEAGDGARYTRGRAPLRLAASSPPLRQSEALRLERFVKRLKRTQKIDTVLRGSDRPER